MGTHAKSAATAFAHPWERRVKQSRQRVARWRQLAEEYRTLSDAARVYEARNALRRFASEQL